MADNKTTGAILLQQDADKAVPPPKKLEGFRPWNPNPGGVRLPNDHVSPKELSGQTVVYNLRAPMDLKHLRAMPEDLQSEYLKWIMDTFDASAVRIGKMLGCSDHMVAVLLRQHKIRQRSRGKKTPPDKVAAWEVWLEDGTLPGIPERTEVRPVEEAARAPEDGEQRADMGSERADVDMAAGVSGHYGEAGAQRADVGISPYGEKPEEETLADSNEAPKPRRQAGRTGGGRNMAAGVSGHYGDGAQADDAAKLRSAGIQYATISLVGTLQEVRNSLATLELFMCDRRVEIRVRTAGEEADHAET